MIMYVIPRTLLIVIFMQCGFYSSGKEIRYSSPNKQVYIILSTLGITISENNFINFKIKACNDVHVALISGNTENDTLYEIVIGGWRNTKSVLRKAKQSNLVAKTAGVFLSCSQYKDFWISWDNITINIGRGDVFDDDAIFLTWSDTAGLWTITNIGFYTAFRSTGEWIFYQPDDTTEGITYTFADDTTKGTPYTFADDTTESTTYTFVDNTTASTTYTFVDDTTAGTTYTFADDTTASTTYTFAEDTTASRTSTFADDTTDSTTYTQSLCMCPCSKLGKWSHLYTMNMTKDELTILLHDELVGIKNNLKIDKKLASSYISTKISAADDRLSSKSIGALSIIFMCIPIVFCIISDVMNIHVYAINK